MRWEKKNIIKYEPQVNDLRVRTGFLWFPKCIDDEYRWLEKTTWTECYWPFTRLNCWEGWKWGSTEAKNVSQLNNPK